MLSIDLLSGVNVDLLFSLFYNINCLIACILSSHTDNYLEREIGDEKRPTEN